MTEEEREVLAEQLTHWKNLRHDLERARMLIELIRKRERMKREHLKMVQSIKELQMKPLNTLIRRMIERLRRKDPADIFAEPVSVDEVSPVLGSFVCAVFSPAYIRHVGPTNFQYRFSFDVGMRGV